MAKMIVLDEIHITVHVPANLPKTHQILRTLKSKRFQTTLRDAIDAVFRRHTSLNGAKVTLSR